MLPLSEKMNIIQYLERERYYIDIVLIQYIIIVLFIIVIVNFFQYLIYKLNFVITMYV